ncbi:ZYRO0A12914p [Zygosaccharomyces rouxii]|uniref:Transaldolase n=1 Tax=Zygosaccharomyces rouxii (strain ATCC 2623 / CBS 732 / NBRC 1130 / NCYC 568 / NRRL Y-229) TaxID=559307 RepID=C5DNZ5_ZYGRC|nr:uncharacterized protein ZYRO0A12914g [Zygosaccharomyces rouxii]KAH9198491.1 hypothetical protein LQ764DRAFT_235515 [Zygosaccharomyces rouxii]CAR25986.1 ZYRO0A12914p [Zygosaccharomyces rouxii]
MSGQPAQKKQKLSSLDQLKSTGTFVVADSGDFASIAKYQPQDSTTNPSLILAAVKSPQYSKLLDVAVAYGKENGKTVEEKTENAIDRLLVEFGKEILKIVPGRVSTEVDARLSFDKEGTIKKALHIIELYKSVGVDPKRVLIKIASTWEGIQAAQELEKEHGVHVNLTLLFSFPQAVAAAEAGVTLVSPFVGRIMDFYKAKTGKTYSGEEDPGVLSVRRIYNYYKKHDYKTIVMGASFRNVDEIKALGGVDFLTISPNLLDELYNSQETVDKVLDVESAKKAGDDKVSFINDEALFRYEVNDDAMATDKLADGIRRFSHDIVALWEIVEKKVSA